MLLVLLEILSHVNTKKADKKAEGFKILLFYWLFLSDIMAVKGLIMHLSHPLPAGTR